MTLTKDIFEKLKDKSFEIAFNPEEVSQCELIEVKGINSFTLEKGQSEPFSIVFETKSDLVYDQNTFMVKNAEIEEFPLFLVPIGADEKGIRYEAIIT